MKEIIELWVKPFTRWVNWFVGIIVGFFVVTFFISYPLAWALRQMWRALHGS
jgi:hypothetical protein